MTVLLTLQEGLTKTLARAACSLLLLKFKQHFVALLSDVVLVLQSDAVDQALLQSQVAGQEFPVNEFVAEPEKQLGRWCCEWEAAGVRVHRVRGHGSGSWGGL